ncbi:unnamed protein product [Penicillium bialowiezense]
MAKLESLKSGYYVWQYLPSTAAAVIFLILFLITTAYHFWKIFQTRVRFMIPFAIGGIFEIIGYAARMDSHNNTGKLMPYCIQSVFILLAPALFAASVYMVLARIIRSVGAEKYSVIRINWLTKTFVICDVVTFILQAGASGMMVSSGLASIGKGVVIAGLVLQVLSFSLFIVTAYVFQIRMHRYLTSGGVDSLAPWKKHLHVLYAISALILIRSVFRVIEYAMGNEGYPLSNEWTLYVFDSVPMFISMVIFAIWYPSELQPFLNKANYSLQSGESIETKV